MQIRTPHSASFSKLSLAEYSLSPHENKPHGPADRGAFLFELVRTRAPRLADVDRHSHTLLIKQALNMPAHRNLRAVSSTADLFAVRVIKDRGLL